MTIAAPAVPAKQPAPSDLESTPPGPSEEERAAINQRNRARLALAFILLLAFVLRAWNLDWDRGTHLQPDERFWSDVANHVVNPDDWDLSVVLDPTISPLNPRVYKPNYVYGTLPLWASEAAAGILMTDVMSPVTSLIDSVGIDLLRDGDAPVRERLRFNTGYDVTIVGRLMSALIDTATVLAVYALARELGGSRRAGLVAALLQALTVLHIQYSHFLGSEPWVAFFVTLTVWGSVRMARGRGGWKTRLGTGVALGFAIGSKLSGSAAAVAPVVAALVVLGPWISAVMGGRSQRGSFAVAWRQAEKYIVLALVAIVAYRIAQPYDFNAGVSIVFNDEFLADIDYLRNINDGGNWPWVQPLVGAAPLWHPLKQMFWWTMGPGLAIAAILGVVRAIQRFRAGERWYAIPLAVVVAYLALVSVQFYAIIRYLQPTYPTLTALAGLAVVGMWNWARETDRTPWRQLAFGVAGLCVAGTAFWAFAFVNGVYANDNARLAAGDWMLENLPPTATVSVQEWDDGLPWGRSSEFTYVTFRPFSFGGDSPEHIEALIAGLDEVDYVIESSNKFYDSLPKTPARFPQTSVYYQRLFDGSLGFELIKTFQNQPSLLGITIDDSGAEEAFTVYDHPTVHIWQKTDEFSVERAWQLLNPDRARTAINAEPRDAYANAAMLTPEDYRTQQDGSSFSSVHRAGANSVVSAISWFITVQLAAWAMAPLILRHGGRFAGAAFGLTKAAGLLMLSVPLWLFVSYTSLTVSRLSVWLAILSTIGIGLVSLYLQRDEISTLWRRHRKLILAAEAVFIAAFVAVLVLRATNPDLWHPARGGEKPMELAYFTAVTGSTTMPPYDPWLAGGSLNYYYFGWWVLSVPTRLLGLAPDIAFNLGVATYAAVAAATVFSTVSFLTALASSRSERPMPVVRAGVLGVVLFMVIGNLDAFRQLVRRIREDAPLKLFDWWDPSRVIKDSPGLEVTEFPAWTVLFGDLHPHFMTMGFFGLTLAACAALVEWSRQGRGWSAAAAAVVLGALTGIIRMVHTWDLPTVGVAAAGSVVVGAILARGPVSWRVRTALLRFVLLGAAHMLITAPYRGHNQVADSGFHRSESTTNLDDWIAHWGIFLLVAIAYLMVRFGHLVRAASTDLMVGAGFSGLGIGLAGAAYLHVTIGSVAAWAFAGMIAALVVLSVEVSGPERSTAHTIVAACWALGFAILVGVEMFTQNADIQRLNTVFKFWLQVWHLFAVAAAFSVVWLVTQRRELSESSGRGIGRKVFAGSLALLLLASLAFPALAIRPRQADRFDTTLGPSLQGHLWLEPGVTTLGVRDFNGEPRNIDPGVDRAIIDWLRANVAGRPTIVEAVGGAEYQWWGRISINTGLPTVVGWRWHQDQQRTLFNYEVNDRNRDVGEFWSASTDAQIDSFLRAYDVSYVVVGSLEVAVADRLTLALLSRNPALIPVFVDGDRVIYEVAKASLAQSSGPMLSTASG